jgi:DegV family protein with EDD domain
MPNNVEALTHVSVGSTGDVPELLAKENNIIVVPGWITFGGKKSIKDNPSYSFDDFFAEIEASKDFPKTSAPGIGVFKERWAQYDGPILPVTAGDKLSSFYTAAVAARNDLRELPEKERRMNIHEPWNSLSMSLGEGFPALIAAKMLAQGIPVTEVIRKLDEVRERTYVFALAQSSAYFEKSGRVSGTKAFVGKLLSIKPCVTAYDNQIVPFKNYRTYTAAIAGLTEFAAEHGPIEYMAALHTGHEEIAQQMKEAIKKIGVFDPEKIIVAPVGKVVASHTGPNTLGFVFIGAPRK